MVFVLPNKLVEESRRAESVGAIALHALCCCCAAVAGMGIEDFSTADQWAPLAKQAVAKAQKRAKRRQAAAGWRAQPMFDLAALASPLRLTV